MKQKVMLIKFYCIKNMFVHLQKQIIAALMNEIGSFVLYNYK